MATSPKYVWKQVMLLLAISVRAQSLDSDIKSEHSELPKEVRLIATLPLDYDEGELCGIAIEKALEDINAFPGLLVGYHLTYDIVDTNMCFNGERVRRFAEEHYQFLFDEVVRRERVHNSKSVIEKISGKWRFPFVLIGGVCPYVTAEIYKYIAYIYQGRRLINQISCIATSFDLADRTKYPTFTRLTAPERLGSAFVQLLATFNWSRIAIIREEGEKMSMPIRDILKELKLTKVDVIASNTISIGLTPVVQQLEVLKNLDARVIVVSVVQSTAMEIICSAFNLDIYGKHFVWIFTDNYYEFVKHGNVDCSVEEMQQAVEGMFFINPVNYIPFEGTSIANITYSDLNAYANVLYNDSYGIIADIDESYLIGKCYDHVWVAALALNCSLNSTLILQNPQKDEFFEEMVKTTADCIERVDFVGTSGRIRFEEGALNPNVELQRIQDAKTIVVAYFRQGNGKNSQYEWIKEALIWKDGIIPIDSLRTMLIEKSIPMSLYCTMCVFAGVGIVFTIACFVCNVIWRKHRIVKMSSPNINSILLAGCLLLYVTIIIKTTATTTKAICAVQLFFFWIGFASAFGSMLSKTWRVHRIFNNKKMKRKMSISDKHLLVIIGIVVTMEAALLIVWESFSPQRVIEQELKKENVTTESGEKVVLVSFYRVCDSEHYSYFIWTFQIMNGALISIGAILAWETRQVHIDALNDSKTIGICLYNVLILSAVGLFLSRIIGDKPVELNGVTSVCTFVGTLVSEMLIFLPKMLAVYRNPIATPQTAVNNEECLTPSNIATQRIEVVAMHASEKETTT
ncbi:gamma-aminobutyric acid type B receptor subunit 2-like [Dreissena polymorpha]|uniref:G-protein coupled receptors family 3 profile domain-containing protein n=1 Tax=Dreissena polymorpha TaxID=45954 RepID=A0A9D4CHK3_DREPO|nr:gamma-aminobutyric acid type B receptor subunit 2-like [Dreissena polymorpha]KAH3724642.1 hypothetical protein DPMN_050464 [Dreissena polymorpha]